MIVGQSQRGISSDGRALALHVRGTGIDARILQHISFVESAKMSTVLLVDYLYEQQDHNTHIYGQWGSMV